MQAPLQPSGAGPSSTLVRDIDEPLQAPIAFASRSAYRIKGKANLQRDIADSNIERVKNREHEHDHVFLLSELCRSKVAQPCHEVGTDSGTEGVNSGQGPWESKVECAEDSLVVDGESEIEEEIHGQP